MNPEPPPPAYRERGRVYHADSCVPLVRAAEAGEVRLEALARGGYPGRRLRGSALPGLRSVGFWDAVHEQGWGLPEHRNEGIELTFLASGQLPVMIERKSLELRHDELMITRPWQPHRLGDPNIRPGRLIWFILDIGMRRPHQTWHWPPWIVLGPGDLAELTRCLRQNEQYVWPGSPELRRGFLDLARALERSAREEVTSQLAVTINEILLRLLEMLRARRIPLRESLISTERSVRQFLGELDGAVDQPWTLDSMAGSCHLGVTRFVHHFRALTNRTPLKHLSHLRVERAKALLRGEPRRPVTEIALACGFQSSQYFANVFRRATGRTPRAWRREGQV